jgi:outer membrane protein assembly factor BamB
VSVSVKGAGFGPSEKISVSLDSTVVGHATSLANGSIRAFKVRIPTVGFGPTALVATGATSKKAAAAAIFITNAWPQLGDGPGRAGYEDNDPVLTNTVDPGQDILLYAGWHFSAGAALTSPAVAGQVVYVGDQSGTLHAVQAYNGTQLWSWHTPDGKAIGSPSIDPVAHMVFVGAADGKLYAISRSGKLAWSATIGSGNVQSPLLARGLVYAASTGGRMAALSKATGSKVWSTHVAGITTAPTFGSSRDAILIPTKGSVTELNASTGGLRWRFRVTRPTSPLVDAGDVYVGSTNHHVYAVSEATGRQIWTFLTGGVVRDSGALVSSAQTKGVKRLYIGSSDDKLYSLNASTGRKLAASPFGANVTGVAIAGDIVLVTTSSGLVEGMRIQGSFVWDYETGGGLLRSPALVDGAFYVAGGSSISAFTPYAAPPQ